MQTIPSITSNYINTARYPEANSVLFPFPDFWELIFPLDLWFKNVFLGIMYKCTCKNIRSCFILTDQWCCIWSVARLFKLPKHLSPPTQIILFSYTVGMTYYKYCTVCNFEILLLCFNMLAASCVCGAAEAWQKTTSVHFPGNALAMWNEGQLSGVVLSFRGSSSERATPLLRQVHPYRAFLTVFPPRQTVPKFEALKSDWWHPVSTHFWMDAFHC